MSSDKSSGSTWVYLHLAVDGSVLYVGRTYKIAERTKQHRASKWSASTARVVTVGRFTHSEACRLERWLIEQLDPPYNYVFTRRWREQVCPSEGQVVL